ncbi:MAG: hypothetical protein LBB14_00775 [Puniceicoccales bacterium]|nr:hypothetical protein [Puniceicoccales bacterium]
MSCKNFISALKDMDKIKQKYALLQTDQSGKNALYYLMQSVALDNKELGYVAAELIGIADNVLSPAEKQGLINAEMFTPILSTYNSQRKLNICAFAALEIRNFKCTAALGKFVQNAYSGNIDAANRFICDTNLSIAEDDVETSMAARGGVLSPEQRERNGAIMLARIMALGPKRALNENEGDAVTIPSSVAKALVSGLKLSNSSEREIEYIADLFIEIKPNTARDELISALNGQFSYESQTGNILMYCAKFFGKESQEYESVKLFFQTLSDKLKDSCDQNSTAVYGGLLETIHAAENDPDVGFNLEEAHKGNCGLLIVPNALFNAKEIKLESDSIYPQNMRIKISKSSDLIPFRSLYSLPKLESLVISGTSTITPKDVAVILDGMIEKHKDSAKVKFLGIPESFSQKYIEDLNERFPGKIKWPNGTIGDGPQPSGPN